ncbi:MAG: amidohydrolase [Micrococcales bacterium]|nr:amidohydrolase [Micrococcales bacterium]
MDIDLILRGGTIVTVDERMPRATALAVHHGRVLAVGDDAALDGLTAATTVDLGGATVVPGFGDAHNHMAWFGLALDEIDLVGQTSLDELYRLVAERAATLGPEEMVVGSGYDDNLLGSHPDRARLDEAAGGREVWLKHRSGHVCTANTPLLHRVGVMDGSAEVPEGGVVVMHGDQPTGVLQEQAQNLVVSAVTPYPLEQLASALAKASAHYATEGLTHVTECGIGAGWLGKTPLELAAYQMASARGELMVRAQVMPCVSALHEVTGHADDGIDFGLDLGLRSGFGDDRVRVGAMKIWTDGSLLARTAAMTEPFACRCGERPSTGYLQDDAERMRRQIVGAHRGGWNVAAHAIGDAAIDFALDTFEQAQRERPRPEARHRIEHAGVISDAQITRMAALGVTPTPQIRFLHDIGDSMLAAIGPEREHMLYRHASFLEAGLRVPGSSDRPVADGAPLKAIASMRSRLSSGGRVIGERERVDAMTALRAYTLDTAWMAGEEDRRGMLRPGFLADLAVLDHDITTVDPATTESATVLATVRDGTATHDTGLGLPTAR